MAAITFGLAHMSLHNRCLDYHWCGSKNIFYLFAYIHHRVPIPEFDVYYGRFLISMFPSIHQRGRMWYELVKYGTMAYICTVSAETRMLVGWLLVPWILNTTAHHAAYPHSDGEMPPLTHFVTVHVWEHWAPP